MQTIGLRSVGIYIGDDQERQVKFWTEKIGFTETIRTPMGNGPAWIEVTSPDGQLTLVLFTLPGQKNLVGTFSNVIFVAEDVQATYEELSARGVAFPGKATKSFWGWWAVFADPDGNTYGVRDPAKPQTPGEGSEPQDLRLPPELTG